jgi:hypothetical protein
LALGKLQKYVSAINGKVKRNNMRERVRVLLGDDDEHDNEEGEEEEEGREVRGFEQRRSAMFIFKR